MSWSSPRCNVGAGPAQTDPQVPLCSWGGGGGLSGGPWHFLEARLMPKERKFVSAESLSRA